MIRAMVVMGLLSLSAGAQEAVHTMTMQAPTEIKWGEALPALPPGNKLAVLYGDPTKQGLFIVRLKMPAAYKIPPHFHSIDELVTVISGSATMGMGDQIDMKTAKTLSAGSFSLIPARDHHFLVAKTDLVVQVTGMGPFDITYINAGDDPRKKTPAKPAAGR
jgi:quercetin dioxygenase-like cupin family protein